MGSLHELPPEIEHITFGYQPLHKLTQRLVQESFNDLTAVIDDMAAMPALQPAAKHSGYSNAHAMTNGDGASTANAQKKMRLMDFVQKRRAQFIKLLVLSQWSREAVNVGKVIDLRVWLEGQRRAYEDAGWFLGDLKRTLEPAKLPNPDIKTALEVLSSGKAPWLPDLGYLPPPPLTPKEILKTLRTINTLLAVRINLHETLPAHLSKFSIANGRVTFQVPDEFEVDLSIGDEDPTTQLYFIDFRFLFLPINSEIPLERLRQDLERQTNVVLEKDGLQGCYDFLHGFVLTHKISVLRRQAGELSRGRWTESIKLETVRRSLVVQYWLNRPGGKSWIELGINSGRKDFRSTNKAVPRSQIGVRWFRDSKEVKDAVIDLSLDNLSIETILKRVIALHTNHYLSSIRARLLEAPLYARRFLSLSLSISATEPADSCLRAQLTASRTAAVSIEPITGNFCLQPASHLFSRLENELNSLKDPASEAYLRIANLRALAAAEEIESRARCVGWEFARNMQPRQEDTRRIFPHEPQRVLYFRRTGWSKSWVVAVSIGNAGESWWIIEMFVVPFPPTGKGHANKPRSVMSPQGLSFGDHQRLPISSATSHAIDPTYAFLSNLDKTAAGMISLFVNVRELNRHRAHHALRPATATFENSSRVPVLFIRFSSLLANQGRDLGSKHWAKDLLKLTYQGISSDSGQATLVTEARLVLPMANINLVKDRVDDDVAFSPTTGAFAFLLRTAVGEPIIEKLMERLRRVERLIRFLDIIRRFNLKCESVSLGRIVFIYSEAHHLTADLGFATDSPVSLNLPRSNPHLRIQEFLVRLLNADRNGLETLTLLLGVTLPLLLSFNAIEQRSTSDTSSPTTAIILPHTADWYQLRYDSPTCAFDVRLRRRRDEVKWHVSEDGIIPPNRDSQLTDELAKLMNENGEGWLGLRTGIAASVDGVREVIEKVDSIVRAAGARSVGQKVGGGDKGSTVTDSKAPSKVKNEVVEID
ncbi:MAG: peptidylprolyl isomerase fpr4 [Chaenotheca gracillima]|nr:MAG: peptidylprolyl isomerase fpr4 [Chaenotheca gracillima]